MSKKVVKKNAISHKKLLALLLKHKKLKVVFVDKSNKPVSRERLMTNNGACLVRYPSFERLRSLNGDYIFDKNGNYAFNVDTYKFSRYHSSCFRDNIDPVMSFFKRKSLRSKIMVEALRRHDKNCDVFIAEVYAGRGFTKRLV